jgi:hypothetical protein
LGAGVHAVGSMLHKKGTVNYKNKLLINIVSELLPNVEYGWQAVVLAYPEKSKEENVRDMT